MKALVIIPTYDEIENIESIVGRVRAATPEVSILIVDDNSPDGTGALADSLADSDASVAVLHRAGKEGLGAAYRAGMTWGLEHGFDRLVEMDADGSHRPEQLRTLLDAAKTADLVVGSRWVSGGAVVNWPVSRRLLSRGGSFYARTALGVPVRDVTGGYRVFTADALRRIRFDEVKSQGYCFQIDMLRRTHAAGLRIVEVPITFVERERGASKMTTDIVVEAMWRVTGWGIRGLPTRWTRRRPALESPTDGPVSTKA